ATFNVDSVSGVPGYQVARRRVDPSDHVVARVDKDGSIGRVVLHQWPGPIGFSDAASHVRAEEVASNCAVPRGVIQPDSVTAPVRDGEALYPNSRCVDVKPDGTDAGLAAVQIDLQDRIIAIGQCVRAGARLRVAIDDYRVGDGRQEGK